MNAREIITELAENKVVEKIVNNIAKRTYPYTADLCQDIYLDLLEKSPGVIEGLYERNELNYFIAKMARNNLLSIHSPYYQHYMRWNERKSELTDKMKDTIADD